jgi:hypothetical protein
MTCVFMVLLFLNSSCNSKRTEETDMASVRLSMVKNAGTTLVHEFPGRVKACFGSNSWAIWCYCFGWKIGDVKITHSSLRIECLKSILDKYSIK